MKSVVARNMIRFAFLTAPFLGLMALGCGGSNDAPNEKVEVNQAEVQSKEKMIEEAYKNQVKSKKSSAPTKSDPL